MDLLFYMRDWLRITETLCKWNNCVVVSFQFDVFSLFSLQFLFSTLFSVFIESILSIELYSELSCRLQYLGISTRAVIMQRNHWMFTSSWRVNRKWWNVGIYHEAWNTDVPSDSVPYMHIAERPLWLVVTAVPVCRRYFHSRLFCKWSLHGHSPNQYTFI